MPEVITTIDRIPIIQVNIIYTQYYLHAFTVLVRRITTAVMDEII